MCLLRLAGFQWNQAGMHAVMHDNTQMPEVERRKPQPNIGLEFGSDQEGMWASEASPNI
jgi:hypothetical protein